MRALPAALEAFRQDLVQRLQLGPVSAVECAVGVAEDDVSIIVTVDLSDGECICASFDLAPGEPFDDDAREFVEDAFALLAAIECALFTQDGTGVMRERPGPFAFKARPTRHAA